MTAPLRVLHVEDSETDARLIARELRRVWSDASIDRVDEPEPLRAALERGGWDLVLCDWSLPKLTARVVIELAASLGFDAPLIIVSGTIGEEIAVEAMRAGARDYVLKDKLARLCPAIERELRERQERLGRRRAEAALRAAEVRYRRIVETTNQGIAWIDADARFTFANARLGAMLGYAPDELVGRRFTEFLSPSDAEHARRSISHSRPGVPERAERELRCRGGATLWARADSTPLFDEQGRYEGRLAILTDISAERRADEALRLSQARLSRLADSGIIGIVVGDSSGAIVEANGKFLEMLGYSRADLEAGAIDWRHLTPPGWEHANAALTAGLRGEGHSAPLEKEYFRKDGTRLPVLVGVAALDERYVISISLDLTELKRAEQALHNTEEQLRQAQKMEAIGILAGGVAHDFNNILTVILSYGEILSLDLPPGDPLQGPVEQIKRAGERAAGLTRQLLAFSRQQRIEPQIVDLNEIIVQLDKLLRRLIREDVELVTRPEPALGACRCDPGQLEQVIMNLVVNARDAMPEGGRLLIETANVELDGDYAAEHLGIEAGSYVMLAVSDNGIGMDKATQARIFEPFFTTKERGKGTGLGLSTVFGIVEQSRGRVFVYSEPGRGTTFKIYFPRTDEAAQAAPKAALPGSRGSETVLLVEDEDPIREVAKEILQRHGYAVLDARNGGEALLTCEQHAGVIDLLVTDVVMPKMSGKQLADRLLPLRPAMRVLFMSGYTDGALVGELAAGTAYLQKPLTPGSLTRKVREVLDAG